MKRSRITEDFEVTPRIMELAKANGWPDPRTEVDAFKDYHLAKGSLMVDWEAAFRTWLRNALRYGSSKPVRTPEPRAVRTREDRPKADQFDPRVKGMLDGLITKLAGSK